MTYEVIYRDGGTDWCTWQRLFVAFKTLDEANAKAADIQRGGRKTIVRTTEEHNSVGMPIGWTPAHVDWEQHQIEFDEWRSEHKRWPVKTA